MSHMFSASRVLVVGDVMLDRYWHGDAGRISPEAPVPVVRVTHDEARPGGAANVALNLSSLGAQVSCAGLVGSDADADLLEQTLKNHNVDPVLMRVEHRTITKLRVLAQSHQMIRLDFETPFARHMIEHMKFAKEMNVPNPVQVENGDIVKLYPGKPEVYDKAPSGRLYVDGNISVVEDAPSIKDRKNLSANGYIEATVLITPKGNIHKRPILTFRGIPVDDTEEFVYGLEDAIEGITRTFRLGSKQQEHNLIDALKIACRKFSKEKTGKKPFTNINLVRI